MNTRRDSLTAVTAAVLAAVFLAPGLLCAQQTGAPPAATTGGIQRETKIIPIASGEWTGPRLRDGQPDVQGHWSNTIANHNNLTDPQGGIPGDPAARPLGPRELRAPSRVTDPPDGQVPFQPWARAIQQDLLANFFNPTKEQYIEPLARCAPAGPTKSLMWHGYEIRQYPGYVLFLFDSGTRIIHLDDKPHLPENIKLWNADSRGRWEGNTLIVDVRNNNGKARLARTGEFASENVHIVERYVFDNDGTRYTYHATYHDPTVYTRPWTITIPARKYTEDSPQDSWHNPTFFANHPGGERIIEAYERTCVENNEGHGEVAAAPVAAR